MTNTEAIIEVDTFLSEVTEIAEARLAEIGEDYVYVSPSLNACLYVHDAGTDHPRPGCIIGTWLHVKHGVELEQFRLVEGLNADEVFERLGLQVSPDVSDVALKVQELQDNGTPWLEAIKIARELCWLA